jgi:GT2 family glycosyltransferase
MIDPHKPDFSNTPVSGRRPVFGYALETKCEKPAVAVVTPFYNAGKEFRETARSVLGQSLQNLEWVVVNDASSDVASLEVLGNCRRGDERIKVVDHATNRGPGAARNTGVAASGAPYLFFLDADDLIEPTTIEKCLWFLISYNRYKFVSGWSVGFGAREYLWKKGFHHGEEFLQSNLATGRAMISRLAFDLAGGYDESITGGLEDWDFWLRCANQGMWGSTIPEFLDWYRRREDHSSRWRNWDAGKRERQFRKELQGKYPKLYAGEFLPMGSAVNPPREPLSCERSRLNPLAREKRRLLMILPGLSPGAPNVPALEFARAVAGGGWEITIAVTGDCDSAVASIPAQITPDVFVLRNFLSASQFYWFLQHLAESRRPDLTIVSDEGFAGFASALLREICPGAACLDPGQSAEIFDLSREDAARRLEEIAAPWGEGSGASPSWEDTEESRMLFSEYLSRNSPVPSACSALYRPLSVDESIVEEIGSLRSSLTWRIYHAIHPNGPAAKALNDPSLVPLDKLLRIKSSKFYSILKLVRRFLPDRLARSAGK